MLETKALFVAIAMFSVLTLVPDREVKAAPEPCKEMVEYLFNTERLKKSKQAEKESEEIDEKEKRRKEKIKQLKNIDAVLEKLVMLQSGTEKPEEKPKGAMEEFMTGYFNILKYLMSM